MLAAAAFKEVYGEAQTPLNVGEEADKWFISGIRKVPDERGLDPSLRRGAMEIVISKYNAQILKLIEPLVPSHKGDWGIPDGDIDRRQR